MKTASSGAWIRGLVVSVILAAASGCSVVKVDTVSGPNKTACGGFDWRVRYTLKTPSQRGGWLIQEINFNENVFNCDKTRKLALASHYWEAWQIPAGGDHPSLRDTLGIGYDDQYSEPDHPITYGDQDTRGAIRFFEGVTLPATMVPNNPNTFAGILNSDTSQPPFWNTVTEEDAHDAKNDWNCCGTTQSHNFKSVPRIGGLAIPERQSQSSQTQVAKMIETIPPWTKAYGPEQMKALRSAAAQIATLRIPEIRQGIDEFVRARRDQESSLDNLSKVYLLVRVLFEVPTSIDRKEAKVFGGWVHPSVVEPSQPFNLMWPLALNERGEIVVVGEFQGYFGAPYDAVGEFDYFQSKFPLRKLIGLMSPAKPGG